MRVKTFSLLGMLGPVALFALAAWWLVWASPPPPQFDYDTCFAPGVRLVLHGASPYEGGCFYNPPWTAALLAPFVLLGDAGQTVMVGLALLLTGWAFRRMGASWLCTLLVLLTPAIAWMRINGQIEWLVYASVLLPPRWGVLLAAIKPQIGGGLIVFWTWQAWRRGRLEGVVRLLAPLGVAFALSVLIYGAWFAETPNLHGVWWDDSVWPWGIPAGVVLLGLALMASEIRLALAARIAALEP